MFENKTIPQVLDMSKTALTNAMNVPAIATALAQYNYTAEKLMEGMALYTQAEQAVYQRHTRKGTQMGGTETLKDARTIANTAYMRHVKLARVAFQGQVESWKALGLDGSRAEAFAAWLTQARQFYTNALQTPAILAGLLPYSITEAELTASLALLDAAEAALAARETARGLALQATRDRDTLLKALKAWVSDLITVARIALADRPQLLEALGVAVKG